MDREGSAAGSKGWWWRPWMKVWEWVERLHDSASRGYGCSQRGFGAHSFRIAWNGRVYRGKVMLHACGVFCLHLDEAGCWSSQTIYDVELHRLAIEWFLPTFVESLFSFLMTFDM